MGRMLKKDLRLEDSGLTLKQEQVVVALALGRTITEISEEYGVSDTTIYEWRQSPEFSNQLKKVQLETVREIRGRLGAFKDDALEVIKELMNDEDAKPDVRLKAACYILDSLTNEVKDVRKMRSQAKKLYAKAGR